MHEMAGPSPEVWFRHAQSCVLSADLIQEDQVDGVDEDKLAQKHVQEYQALVFDLRTI